jgi:predicted esterase
MKYLSLTILLFIANLIAAQTMYLDSVFSDIEKTTHTYDIIEGVPLDFDYYINNNNTGKAPLIVYVHGGGFSEGKRDSEEVVDFVKKLAQHGYAVISVSYRLTMKGIGFGCDVKAEDKVKAIDEASKDISKAVKYIIDNKKTFSIDDQKIVIAGSSAGAEVVLNIAYVYESGILPSNFKFGGVISMAGAITTLDKIDFSTAIPTQLFHGTGDRLVPFDFAPHHYCNIDKKGHLMLYGSKPIANRLNGLNESYYLYSVSGGTHDWAISPMTKCFDEIIDFLYYDIINSTSIRQTTRSLSNK